MNSSAKKLLSLLLWSALFLGVAPPLKAVTLWNEQLNYQGQLTDLAGQAVADQAHTVQFRIYNAASGGSLLWGPEQHNNVNTSKGLFNVILGSQGLPINLTGAQLQGDLWLSVRVLPDVADMDPRQQLLPSMWARNAQYLSGLSAGNGPNNLLQLDGSGQIPAGLIGSSSVPFPLDLQGSAGGFAIRGVDTGAGGYGLYGEGVKAGVYGTPLNSSADGVVGETFSGGDGSSDAGVRGNANNGIGVYGKGYYGGFFEGQVGSVAVWGQAPAGSTYGTLGDKINNTGVYGVGGVNSDGVKGQTSGSSQYGLRGDNLHASGTGIYANGGYRGIHAVGNTFGVYGQVPGGAYGVYGSAGNGGIGVEGSGTWGVHGLAAFTGGRGVYGEGTTLGNGVYATSGSASYNAVYGINTAGTGIYGQSNVAGYYAIHGSNSSGTAIYGAATANTYFGVYGTHSGTTGEAVKGFHTGTGAGSGVRGETSGTGGIGVLGLANPTSGVGVQGQSTASTGTGVKGMATAVSGVNYGVYGQAASASGYGVYGTNPVGPAVYGTGQTGVHGVSSSIAGVRGVNTASNAFGVLGENMTASGGLYPDAGGVRGVSSPSLFSAGVRAEGYYGLYAESPYDAIWARSTGGAGTAYGIFAETNSPFGEAGHFTNLAAAGAGNTVYSVNNAPQGSAGRFVQNNAGGTAASPNFGLVGENVGQYGIGVFGRNSSTLYPSTGVMGEGEYVGVSGKARNNLSGSSAGVWGSGWYGIKSNGAAYGIWVEPYTVSGGAGFYFQDTSQTLGGYGVYSYNYGYSSTAGYFYNTSSTSGAGGYALQAHGRVHFPSVTGTFTVPGGSLTYAVNNDYLDSGDEVFVTAKTDMGNTPRYWVTIVAGTFTLNFSVAPVNNTTFAYFISGD